MDTSEFEHLQGLIATHQAALRELEKQRAVYGLFTPVHLLLDIRNRKNEIHILNSRIRALRRLAALEVRLGKDVLSKEDLDGALKDIVEADRATYESITGLSQMTMFFARYLVFLSRGMTIVGIGVIILLCFTFTNRLAIQAITAQLSRVTWPVYWRGLEYIATGIATLLACLFVVRTRALTKYWNEMKQTDFVEFVDISDP